ERSNAGFFWQDSLQESLDKLLFPQWTASPKGSPFDTSGHELEMLWALNVLDAGDLMDPTRAPRPHRTPGSSHGNSDIRLLALNHKVPAIQIWAIRLLGDFATNLPPDLRGTLNGLAAASPNLEVRAQLACTAKRLPAADALPIVRNLILSSTRGSTGHWPVPPGDPPGGTSKAFPSKTGSKRNKAGPALPVGGSPTGTGESPMPPIQDDARDPRIPLLIWWAIESKCESDRDAVLKLFEDSPLWTRPIVEQHILERLMRRFASAGTR